MRFEISEFGRLEMKIDFSSHKKSGINTQTMPFVINNHRTAAKQSVIQTGDLAHDVGAVAGHTLLSPSKTHSGKEVLVLFGHERNSQRVHGRGKRTGRRGK